MVLPSHRTARTVPRTQLYRHPPAPRRHRLSARKAPTIVTRPRGDRRRADPSERLGRHGACYARSKGHRKARLYKGLDVVWLAN